MIQQSWSHDSRVLHDFSTIIFFCLWWHNIALCKLVIRLSESSCCSLWVQKRALKGSHRNLKLDLKQRSKMSLQNLQLAVITCDVKVCFHTIRNRLLKFNNYGRCMRRKHPLRKRQVARENIDKDNKFCNDFVCGDGAKNCLFLHIWQKSKHNHLEKNNAWPTLIYSWFTNKVGHES